MCKGKSKGAKDFFLTNKWGALIVGGVSSVVVSILSKVLGGSGLEIFLSAVVSFLLPEVVIHNLCEESIIKRRIDEHEKNTGERLTEHENKGRDQLQDCTTAIETYSTNKEKNAETHICSLINYLAEESFKRCTQYDTICKNCKKFNTSPNECNGLLRKFLYEDCKSLSNSIKNTENGKYVLTNDIENYHEIAIKYMLAFKSQMYGVIQTISTPKSGKYNYNSLDFFFLNKLLENVQSVDSDSPNNETYYKYNNFKIKWLLVGNYENMKNTYDYIFHVISKLPKDQQKEVGTFFEFYNISNDTFKQKIQGKTNLMQLVDKKKPSLGVFGKRYIFVESLNGTGEHGEIITTKDSRVPDVINLFEELISCSTKLNYDELYNKYLNIIKNNATHDTVLANRWSKNN